MGDSVKDINSYFLYNPWYWFFIIVCLAIGIIIKVFYPKIIGWFGEHWTKQVLNKLQKDKYYILNNVMIKDDNGYHQIDHLVVSLYGIFVIETKQYNGYITGSKYDKKWIRHLGKKKVYYSNPIRQNYGHVKCICNLLNLDESKVFNIVCVPSRAKLDIKHDGELVRNYNLYNKIMSYKEIKISNKEEIINIINSNNIVDKKVRKEHINNIKENIIDKDSNKCPKCGSDLVKRKGQYGEFLGCSNYPKCKYTKNI